MGTDAIQGTSATGQCTPQNRDKIRLVASQPHMRTKGIHMKVELTRAGAKQIVHDQPFDLDFQRADIHNLDILPGDRLTTPCTYSAPARFGKRHGPRGALVRSHFNAIVHGPNTCID